jgi:hypothetical protein
MKVSVKMLVLLVLLVLNCSLLKAQKHFIYIQSEDKQPFAVVLNGKVFSSSDYGYVIIPKLDAGKYDFTVSFPMNKFPDQFFSCTVDDKDQGYTLKSNTGGWALESLQAQNLLDNANTSPNHENAFGNMLSDVVDDSTLTQKKLPPADTVADAPVVKKEPSLQPEKIAETKMDTGTNMLFVDKTTEGADTVSIFIPSETVVVTSPATEIDNQNNPDTIAVKQEQQNMDNPVTDNAVAAPDTSAHEISNPFYKPAEDGNENVANANAPTVSNTAPVLTSAAIREDCNSMISDDDLDKLKRKMFTRKDDKDMIDYAVKHLQNKCLLTDQVKMLGQLFSSDDGRYNLFEALYDYTYDFGKYPALSGQIVDPYYKKRFLALLR